MNLTSADRATAATAPRSSTQTGPTAMSSVPVKTPSGCRDSHAATVRHFRITST